MKAQTRYQIILLGDRGTIDVNNLPRVVAWQCTGRESNPRPSDHKSDALAITLPSHQWSIVFQCFSAVGWQEGHPSCKKFCHNSSKSLLLGTVLTWSDSRKLGHLNKKLCVCVCVCVCTCVCRKDPKVTKHYQKSWSHFIHYKVGVFS